jgi:uncharacterized protein (DUF1697 family)
MPRYVALFRGINVGKAKRIAMADLRELLQGLGYTNVQTLLNSGNAVFSGRAGTTARMAVRVHAAVADELGVDAQVIIKSDQDIAAIFSGNKLEKIATDPSRLLVAMAGDGKALAALAGLARQDWDQERVHVGTHAAYIWCPNGILESPALEASMRAIGATGTTRNWATLGKIHALMTAGS